ncbi:uncharacterized protein K444DRAFT_635815 [Hyaloscypha bicolor E]|uniref:Uncharacterized protein n=1 Tax=Hyaloscypha bicolor E TaxID=1095630 RepID=A0A2J6SQ39_9HELO|nr:uncharacterized protein K444DRAFT_635815 [Hyaloscypha bicolor E]PMD52879.1 hypothetical protein K444DRAFT_635815 [Hyaloscypha bicolor E]
MVFKQKQAVITCPECEAETQATDTVIIQCSVIAEVPPQPTERILAKEVEDRRPPSELLSELLIPKTRSTGNLVADEFIQNRQEVLKRSVEYMKLKLGWRTNDAGIASAQLRGSGDQEMQGMLELLARAKLVGANNSQNWDQSKFENPDSTDFDIVPEEEEARGRSRRNTHERTASSVVSNHSIGSIEPGPMAEETTYVFPRWDIKSLKTLALFKLHKTLTSFTLYAVRRPDIVALLRYTFSTDHTPDLVDTMDDLRLLVMLYTACEVESLIHCPEFLSLIGEGGQLAQNLVQMLMKRIS